MFQPPGGALCEVFSVPGGVGPGMGNGAGWTLELLLHARTPASKATDHAFIALSIDRDSPLS